MLTEGIQSLVRRSLAAHEYPRAVAYVKALPDDGDGEDRAEAVERDGVSTTELPAPGSAGPRFESGDAIRFRVYTLRIS